MYECNDVKVGNTKENPFNVVPRNKGNAELRDNVITAMLPKLSWNVIRLTKSQGQPS